MHLFVKENLASWPFKIIFIIFILLACGRALAAPPEIPAPEVDASAWVLMDHHSGQVLAQSNAEKALPPASLTKLMTAYVLFAKLKTGALRLEDDIPVSPRAAAAKGARLFLRPGTPERVETLIKGMTTISANDAAVALAEHVANSEAGFVQEMNAAAAALGLSRSHFLNVTGHDSSGHVATALDLARLTSALIRDYPEYYRWFAIKELTHRDITQYNHNALLWRDHSVDGVKTGLTRAADYCVIASAQRDHMRLIAVVLGAANDTARVNAAQKLLDHGFQRFETRLLYAADVPAVRVRIWMGERSQLPVGVPRDLYLTLPRGWHEKLSARLVVKQSPTAPVIAGQELGHLTLLLDQQPYAEYPLVALRAIDTGNFLQRSIDKVQLWLQ